MTAEMTITRGSLAGGSIVAARGVIDVHNAIVLQGVLAVAAVGHDTLTLDLAGVEVGGGAAVALLVNAIRRAAATGARVRAVCPHGPLRSALGRTGVARKLELVERLDEPAPADRAVPILPGWQERRVGTARRRNTLVAEATLAIEAHHGDPDLRLDQVARRIATSPRQLQRVFDEHGGTNFRAELNAVRMQHAAELLLTTDLQVNEIAARVGHRQPAQFARAFRAYHGHAPTAFRRATGDQRASCACRR